ncbi:DUF3592 domain-containing protein [Noviherbaspirillum humi]|uniref:DUF3592 domain-containing protein n=1 Tax=Noviherbaspirillum humi TaxID=1688639 RepID=UPI0015961FA1|nr:DUF3592 domain-containing protein [Noviherbaspirillum humi]
MSAKTILEIQKTNYWPSVSGTIISSLVRVEKRRGVSYWPEVKYRYQHDGQLFIGSKIWMYEGGETEPTARELINEYLPGKPVRVYFDPENPASSVLRIGLNPGAIAWLAVALFGTVFGAVMLYFTFFSNQDRRRPE